MHLESAVNCSKSAKKSVKSVKSVKSAKELQTTTIKFLLNILSSDSEIRLSNLKVLF